MNNVTVDEIVYNWNTTQPSLQFDNASQELVN